MPGPPPCSCRRRIASALISISKKTGKRSTANPSWASSPWLLPTTAPSKSSPRAATRKMRLLTICTLFENEIRGGVKRRPRPSLLLLLLASACASARQARLDAALRGPTVYGAVQYLDSHSQEVLASLWDGLRAEITFQLRLYRRNRGLLSFLGDRLLAEQRVVQTAAFDVYENRYKITEGRQGDRSIRGGDGVFGCFFLSPRDRARRYPFGGSAGATICWLG